MSLIGLKNVVIIYNAHRNQIIASQKHREVYLSITSEFLTSIGDGLKLLDEHSDELQDKDLGEELKLHKAWNRELPLFVSMPLEETAKQIAKHKLREPQVGNIINQIQGILITEVMKIEVLSRPQAINSGNRIYSDLARIKVPKGLSSFDDLLHRLCNQVSKLNEVLANIRRGYAFDMQDVISAVNNIVPLFSVTLEEFEKIME